MNEHLNWMPLKDEEGRTYYFNRETGTVTWEKPKIASDAGVQPFLTSNEFLFTQQQEQQEHEQFEDLQEQIQDLQEQEQQIQEQQIQEQQSTEQSPEQTPEQSSPEQDASRLSFSAIARLRQRASKLSSSAREEQASVAFWKQQENPNYYQEKGQTLYDNERMDKNRIDMLNTAEEEEKKQAQINQHRADLQFVAGEAPGPNLSTGNPWEVDHGDQTKHVKMRRASFITPSFQ